MIRARCFTLDDFTTRGRAYFSDDFSIEPQIVTADDTHVVVISRNAAKGEEWESADVFTFEGDQVKSFRGIEETDAVERAFPGG